MYVHLPHVGMFGGDVALLNRSIVQSETKETRRRCAHCDKEAPGMKHCNKCKLVYYCSEEHRKEHYASHKIYCRKHNKRFGRKFAPLARNVHAFVERHAFGINELSRLAQAKHAAVAILIKLDNNYGYDSICCLTHDEATLYYPDQYTSNLVRILMSAGAKQRRDDWFSYIISVAGIDTDVWIPVIMGKKSFNPKDNLVDRARELLDVIHIVDQVD